MLLRQSLDFGVIDQAGVHVDPVLHSIEDLAGKIDLCAVCQVAAMRQAHTEDGVSWLEQRKIDRGIRLRTGVRLHIGVIGTEQLLRTGNREVLSDVDILAAAVIAFARRRFRY